MKLTNRFLVAAAALAVTSAAYAQDAKGTPAAGGKIDQRPVAAASSLAVFNAEEVIGAKVYNAQNEELGKIDDIAVYSNGQIAYGVLSYGGVLGVGDKLFAIPWSLVRASHKPEDNTVRLAVNVDKERLKSAPGFDKKNWPTTAANYGVFDDTDKYYDAERRTADADRKMNGGVVEASAARTPNTIVWRVSELRGKNVENSTGDKLGDIKNVYVDPTYGRINYVAVSVGGFLGIGDRIVAVPWDAIKTSRVDDKEKLTLNTTKEQLEKAPQYKIDKGQMREMVDPVYIGKVYTFYSVRPYWNDAMTTPTGEKPEKKN